MQQQTAAGAVVVKNPDGSVSLGGQKLPPGVTVSQNPDGSLRLEGMSGAPTAAALPAGLAVRKAPDGSLTVVAATAGSCLHPTGGTRCGVYSR